MADNKPQPLIIAVDHIPPYITINKDTGEITGSCAMKVRSLIDQSFEFKIVPWKRAFRELVTGEVDIIPCADKNPERVAQGIHFFGPVVSYKTLLVSHKSKAVTVDNFRQFRGVFLRGDDEPQTYEIKSFQSVGSVKAIFKTLLSERADYSIMPELMAIQSPLISQLNTTPLISKQAYMLLSPQAAKKINTQALQQKIIDTRL